MIVPGVFFAFVVGLLAEATVMFVLDRRAIRRETEFWEDLRLQAMTDYGRVFDWETD